MSSDFLEDIDEDRSGSTVFLTMKASGDAILKIMYSDDTYADYHLPANDDGLKNAKEIVKAINGWIEHIEQEEKD